MVRYAQEGRQADALDAYRRCKHMSSVVLGAADTDALWIADKGWSFAQLA